MDFSIKYITPKSDLTQINTPCLVIGIDEQKNILPESKTLTNHKILSQIRRSLDVTGKIGSIKVLYHIPGIAAERIVLVGLGKSTLDTISQADFLKAAQALATSLSELGASEAFITLLSDGQHADMLIRTLITTNHATLYHKDHLKSKRSTTKVGIKKMVLASPGKQQKEAENTRLASIALAKGIELTQHLADLPANICTPTYLAETAKKIGEGLHTKTSARIPLEVTVLSHKQCEALKMGSFLSVTKGSEEAPKFIILKHLGGRTKDAPIVLVGKGITFDSGGISLKPGPGMDEMKYDMCGAATVLGVLSAIHHLQLKLNVIALIPSCENMPSGRSTKPGDIVTSMSGQTIEVLNTDAEGRLILCDALTYAERFKPAVVIDIATLTGACVTALGHHHAALFTRDDKAHNQLANELLAAGIKTGDTAWRMPIGAAYDEQLKSNFADMANVGGPAGGAITAACFLERFTKAYTWAHLDIAGVAWKSGASKGATGRPVALITQFLIDRAHTK